MGRNMTAPVVTSEPEIVSKAEFARLSNVSRARVAQWLGAKKIFGDAIVGEGRGAQIHVARARAQLKLHLDISQRMGNGLSTRLDGPAAAAAPAIPPQLPLDEAPGAQAPRPPDPPRDPLEEQIKRERLETARRVNRKMAEEEAARAGRYVLAADATREMGRLAADLVGSLEGWLLGELCSATAAKFGLQYRDVQHLFRTEFRTYRASEAAVLRRRAEQMPEFVEDDPVGAHADALPTEPVPIGTPSLEIEAAAELQQPGAIHDPDEEGDDDA
jgi:hypothetical protein